MDGAITFARRPRHDGDPGIEEVITGHIQVGMTTAEDLRKQVLQTRVNLVEGVLKADPGFLVNLADGDLQRIQCLFKVFVLSVQIYFAFRLLRVFVYRGEVDWPQALNPVSQFLKRLLALLRFQAIRKPCQNHVEIKFCRLQLLQNALTFYGRALALQADLHQGLTHRIQLFQFLVSLLLQGSDAVLVVIDPGFCHGQFLLHLKPVLQQ